MKIITNAIVFAAELPSIDLMAAHLAEVPFEPVGEVFCSRAGFIPNSITGELVTPIEGGFSFTVRSDEKILPKASVNAAVAEAERARAEELERDLDDDERGAVREATVTRLIANALVKTTVVHCFYSIADQYLIVPTTAKPLAQTVMGLLIKATGSVKTATIHVDNIKGGLTTRLRNFLDGDEKAFDGFTLGDTCNMKLKSDKANFNMADLTQAKQGLIEALEGKMEVELMELVHGTMSFKLTNDFKLRAISFHGELTEDEEEQRDGIDAAFLWRLDAATQLLQLVATIKSLCELFEYKRPELVEAVLPAKDTDAVMPEENDPLYDEAVAFVRESRRASVSAVQRKLKLGYNRAARMIERMERDGIVTPMNSNGSREVMF